MSLAIRIEFTQNRYGACIGSGENAVPEWPMHPDRFYMAGHAGCAKAGEPPLVVNAMRLIEKLGAPSIWAEDATSVSYNVWRPPADPKAIIQRLPELRNMKPDRHHSTPTSEPTYLIWPNAEPTAEELEGLKEMCRLITRIGNSSSMVVVRVVEDAPEPNLIPSSSGIVKLRVPSIGRFDTLKSCYGDGINRIYPVQADSQWYASPPATGKSVKSVFGQDILVFNLVGGVSMPLVLAPRMADAFRKAIIPGTTGRIHEIISGHEGNAPAKAAHAAYVCLPFVGHKHADASIKSFAVVWPLMDVSENHACLAAVARRFGCDSFELDVPGIGVVELGYGDDSRTLWSSSRKQWCGTSLIWESVTPVVLDRHPKNRSFADDVLAGVVLACKHAGLPSPVKLEFGDDSWATAAPSSTNFPSYAKGGRRWMTHVRMEFDVPVEGPVLIGAGRYCGYGLCRPGLRREDD